MDFVSAAPAFLVAGEGGNEELQEDGQLLEFGGHSDADTGRRIDVRSHPVQRDVLL
jgi:hypothetical protein